MNTPVPLRSQINPAEQTLVGRVIALCALRTGLLAAGTFLVVKLVQAAGIAGSSQEAWQIAGNHRDVTVSLASDIPCLLILAAILRREGSSLGEMIGYDPKRLRKDIVAGFLVFVLFVVGSALVPLVTAVIANPYPSGLVQPPMWTVAWTMMIFPVTTGLIEECLFRGYAMPRLRKALGLTASVLIPAFFFAIPHHFIPALGSPETHLARFVYFMIVGIYVGVIYLKVNRLMPMIIGHVLFNSVVLGALAYASATA